MTPQPEQTRMDLIKKEGFSIGLGAKTGRKFVHIDRLKEDPQNERKVFRGMEGLTASMRKVGLLEPITVTPDGDYFRILTGHRRARAAKEIGLKEVEILVREPEADATRRWKSLISNVQREDISAVEAAEALMYLAENDPEIKSRGDLARALGKSEPWISDTLRILSLPEDLLEKVRLAERIIPYDTLGRLARIEDKSEQQRLVELALAGSAPSEIRREIKERVPSKVKRESKKVRLTETRGGFNATVTGPTGPGSHDGMRDVLEALLEKIDADTLGLAA